MLSASTTAEQHGKSGHGGWPFGQVDARAARQGRHASAAVRCGTGGFRTTRYDPTKFYFLANCFETAAPSISLPQSHGLSVPLIDQCTMLIDRIARFCRKPTTDKLKALRASIGYLAEGTEKRERMRLHQTLSGQLVAARVLKGKSPLYLTFRPDAEFTFHEYPELAELSEKWVANNIESNAGDLPRLYALVMNLKQVFAAAIPGHLAELGVYRGNSAAVMAHFARAYGRQLFLFDTFEGFDPRDLTDRDFGEYRPFVDTSLGHVQDAVGKDSVHYIKGYFPASVPSDLIDVHFSVVHLDCDLYEPMKAGLAFFYPRLSPGGLMIMHDYANPHWAGVRQAVDEFALGIPEGVVVLPDKSGTAMIRKCAAVEFRIRQQPPT
jgi:hypothetical protein